jgi:tetratricopeptide (TPR) repeat protein
MSQYASKKAWLAGLLALGTAATLGGCSSPDTVDTPPPKPAEKPEEKPADPPATPGAVDEAKPASPATAEEKPDEPAKPEEKPADAKPGDSKPGKPADIKYADSPAKLLIDEGVQFLTENNLADAQQKLLNAAKQDPKSATAWYNLAICQYRMGADDDALESAKKAFEVNPSYSRAAVLLSVLHLRRGQAAQAVAVVDDALAKRPGDAMLLGAKARALVANAEYNRALDACVEALRLDQSNPEVMRYLAEAYLGLGRVGLARLALERAYEVYTGEEVKAAISGEESSGPARKQYELRSAQGGGSWRGVGAEAVTREAGLAHIHYLYGRLYMADGEWESARDQFRKATQLRVDYAEAWNNLGVCWIVARKGDEAVEAVNKALELQPTWIEARINLGSAWRVTRDPEKANKARAAYEQALKQDPRRAEAHFNLGILFLENPMADMANDEARYAKSLEYLNAYKEIRGAGIDAKDPIDKYIADAKLFLTQEQTKRINAEKNAKEAEEYKRKKAEEDAKKADEDAKKAADEAAKKQAAEDAKRAEEEAKKKAEETPAPTPPPDGAAPAPAPDGSAPAPSPEPAPAPAPSPEPAPTPAPPPADGKKDEPPPAPPSDPAPTPAPPPSDDKKDEPPPPPSDPAPTPPAPPSEDKPEEPPPPPPGA